jgi:hypothetical protein
MAENDTSEGSPDGRSWAERINPPHPERSTPVIAPEVAAKIELPIILNEGRLDRAWDLEIHDTLKSAELAIEPHDVGECQALDSNGRLLRILPDWLAYCARFEPATEQPEHLDVLRDLLRDHLLTIGAPASDVGAMSKDEMLAAIRARQAGPVRGEAGAPWAGLWRLISAKLRSIFGR